MNPRACVLWVFGVSASLLSCSRPGNGPAVDYGSQQATPCEPTTPGQLPEALVNQPLDWLAGLYSFRVVATRGYSGDTMSVGRLHLLTTDESHRAAGPGARTSPLYGWTEVDLSLFGRVGLAYSPTSRDPNRPGVQVIVDREHKNLGMVVGAASTGDTVYFDAGVVFFVYAVDSLGFSGLWKDGGLTGLPAGYFCAQRPGGN